MKTYKIVTLGCRTNQYESQALANQLVKKGYVEVQEGEKASVCIVNTCTVTESADKRSFYQIRKMVRDYAPETLVVTGCLAESLKKDLEAIHGVTHVIPNHSKEDLLLSVFPDVEWPEFKIERFEARTRAFVKIQDGCNSYCSYCVIPFVRGRSRSRTIPDILKEIKDLVAGGYKEVVLTGINIGDFDGAQVPAASLADLVQEVDQISGLERVRISSIDPDEVGDSLIEAILSGTKTAPSLHLVLQSGSNITLKRMRRKYTKQNFFDVAERLFRASPMFTLTTDVIVGFPGETEEEFQETLDVLSRIPFAKVHVFPYSDRPKTRASRMPNKIPLDVIQKRKALLLKRAEACAYQLREHFIGRSLSVLLEEEGKPGYFFGHTENFLPVYISKKNLITNTLVQVKCVDNTPEGLIGEH